MSMPFYDERKTTRLKEVIIEFCEKYNKKYTICSKGGKITIN